MSRAPLPPLRSAYQGSSRTDQFESSSPSTQTDCYKNYPYAEYRAPNSTGCLDSYNTSSPIFADWSSENAADRPWYWMLCNEPFKYWQTGSPGDRPTMVSRLVTAQYWYRQCDLYFPPQGNATYAAARGSTVDMLNGRTGGWLFTESERLLWVNG